MLMNGPGSFSTLAVEETVQSTEQVTLEAEVKGESSMHVQLVETQHAAPPPAVTMETTVVTTTTTTSQGKHNEDNSLSIR